MKWVQKDIEMFQEAREHIDTVLVPMIGIDMGTGMKQSAQMQEFLAILASEIERQFKGRMILLPPFTYWPPSDSLTLQHSALSWKNSILEEGFKHVFFITCDSLWRGNEGELGGSLIWIPSIPLEGLDDHYKRELMSGQVSQIANVFAQKWLVEK
ncbi:YpiF family protein [Peribacillus kribbensis]|uniref:YpiF family protein n=1 Tax=Peribacillus kribbensis TaxID=356658 RepID=UPI00041ABECB|nr:YpiF family protein [Peribacillus kribbensis]